MCTNNDEKINELYSKMLDTADTMSSEGINKESMDALKSIKDGVNQLTLNENATEMDENVNSEAKTDDVQGEFGATSMMESYNPTTGERFVVDGSESIAERIADRHLNNLIVGGENTSKELINDVLKELMHNANGVSDISSLIYRRIAGENFDAYKEMPDDYKRQIDMICYDTNLRANSINSNKRAIATAMLDEMIKEFKMSIDSQVDLETILSGFDSEVNKMANQFSAELGGMMMSFDEERKAEIDAAIKRCEESGKTEAIANLKAMRDNIDDAFNLNRFIEFCKTCKIRNIESREPEKRVFSHFNRKYENHRYTINDIRSCPDILDRHLVEYSHLQNTLLCIAFCKYCKNMIPDNMNEHTFMYYFIRNIIAIDRLNPKGRMYSAMDERSKRFYDSFMGQLRSAMEAILERNPNFRQEASESGNDEKIGFVDKTVNGKNTPQARG